MGYKKWCLNGCGKKVTRILFIKEFENLHYQCEKCDAKFSKEQLDKYAKGE